MGKRCFFAAANGYSGFRSNFEKVFCAADYRKLFIIKGGPGTGKSTLMKKISRCFADFTDITEIFCSSDPESLDGVIIEKDGVRIGIVDGTAPHSVEPNYPGAVEEIVNLGDSFNYCSLMKSTKQIIALNSIKKAYYQKAYSALNIAGSIHKYIMCNLIEESSYNAAEILINTFLNDLQITTGNIENKGFLIGAFSKRGYNFTQDKCDKKAFYITGDGISEYICMSKLKEILSKKEAVMNIYHSAFSDTLIDGIETEDYIFRLSRNKDSIDSGIIIKSSDEYSRLKNMYLNMLSESQYSFEKSSENHFMLEDIYSKCISFEMNDAKYDRIVDQIYSFLSK